MTSSQIELDQGVAVEVFAHTLAGEPLDGVKTGGSQGRPPDSVQFFETETGPDGKARVAGLDALEPVNLVCVAPGFRRYEMRFDAPPAAFDCALEPLATLRGAVVTGDAEPVVGATVHLPEAGRQAMTAEDGRFELRDLPPADHRVVVSAPGFRVERVEATLAPGEKRELPAVELLPASEIECLIRDARHKRPVAGASLSSLDPPGLIAATTDAEGRCRFGLGEEGPIRIEVAAEGYPETIVDLDPSALPEEGPWTVELKPGGRILAEVWDEEHDEPCQGCSVNVQGAPGSRRLLTDGQGEALSAPLAEGTYSVGPEQVRSLGSVVQVQGGHDRKEVTVASGEVVTVRFGEPSRRLRLRLRPPPPEGWSLSASAGGTTRLAEAIEPGLFELRRPGSGPVLIELSHGSGTAAVRLATVTADQESAGTLDIELPLTQVRGSAVSPEGALAGMKIEAVSAERGEPSGWTVSSAGGGFLLPFLRPGTYSLLVSGRPIRSFQLGLSEELDLGTLELGDGAGLLGSRQGQ